MKGILGKEHVKSKELFRIFYQYSFNKTQILNKIPKNINQQKVIHNWSKTWMNDLWFILKGNFQYNMHWFDSAPTKSITLFIYSFLFIWILNERGAFSTRKPHFSEKFGFLQWKYILFLYPTTNHHLMYWKKYNDKLD